MRLAQLLALLLLPAVLAGGTGAPRKEGRTMIDHARRLLLALLVSLLVPALGWGTEITVARQGQKWLYTVKNSHSTAQIYVVQIENKTGASLKVESPRGWEVMNNDGHNVALAAFQNRDRWIGPGQTLNFAVYSSAKGVAEEPYLIQGTDNVMAIGLVAVPSN